MQTDRSAANTSVAKIRDQLKTYYTHWFWSLQTLQEVGKTLSVPTHLLVNINISC